MLTAVAAASVYCNIAAQFCALIARCAAEQLCPEGRHARGRTGTPTYGSNPGKSLTLVISGGKGAHANRRTDRHQSVDAHRCRCAGLHRRLVLPYLALLDDFDAPKPATRDRRRHREPDRSPRRNAARLRALGARPSLGGHGVWATRARNAALVWFRPLRRTPMRMARSS